MRKKGKIRSWNEEKAFGFIQPSDGGKELFLHISALNNRDRRPEKGEKVTYTLSTDKQGRPCAAKALLAGERLLSQKKKGPAGAILAAVVFLCIVAILVLTSQLPVLVLWVYLAVSLVTFLVYAFDKKAARNGTWRTSESTLHWLSLIGGWPGALLAQQVLRHKSKKQSFRTVFWITAIINCVALIWFCTPDGTQLLQEWATELLSGTSTPTIEWAE